MEKKNILGLTLSFLVFVTTLVAIYMFSTLNLSMSNFLTINLFPIITALISVNGIMFIILAGIPIALILLIGEEFDYYHALMLAEVGYILAAVIGTLLFGLIQWLLPLVFAALGIAWSIQWLRLKEDELKSKLKFSAGAGAAEKIILIALFGFLIFLAITSFSQRSTLEENFVPELLDITLGDQDDFKYSITDMTIKISVDSQKAIVNSLTELDSYKTLSTKGDTDVLTFVVQMEAIKTEINRANYSDTLKEQVIANSENVDITSQVLEKLPALEFAQHIWLFYIIFALILVHMIGSLIIKNLAAGYYVVFKIIYEKLLLKEKVESFESKVEKDVANEVTKEKISKKAGVKGPFDEDDLPD